MQDVEFSKPAEDPERTTSNRSADGPGQESNQSKLGQTSEPALPDESTASDTQAQRRPPVRIDTQTGITSYFRPSSSEIVESPATLTAATPRKTPSTPSIQDQPKRATRISSGALQKKSVSEILGEAPKVVSPQMESPLSALSGDFSPNTAQSRQPDKDKPERERSKLSTVVFAKPARSSDASDTIEVARKSPGDAHLASPKERDYLYSLFESRAYSPPKNTALSALMHDARKTLTTGDHMIDYREQLNCRAMKRIYQLQNANRWPLRQVKRAEEVARPTSHWDFVLDHAKWMRTDFREERRWKLAAASAMADMCADWVASTPDQRMALQVRARVPTSAPVRESPDTEMMDEPVALSPAQPTPDLVPSGEDDSVTDLAVADPGDLSLLDAPAAIFSLGPGELSFAIEKTPASDKLLNELPLYQPAGAEPDVAKSDLAERLDAKWKQDIVPVSKFANEKIRRVDPEPPQKKSRFTYELEDSLRKEVAPLPPRQTNVALFQSENKHMRDRIHPGQSFRPPTEHPMPTQSFFESRSSSQWTQVEDDELRRLVKDYSYNWSLISACLTSKSLFSSGADRRTPWECFERWIGLEGLPADMSKTPYFRTYHSRLEAASRHVQAQMEAAQARAGVTGLAVRKRTTQPVRVERKRGQKHLAMLDAMRRLCKKRETAAQKAQHQAELAAMRKVNDVNQLKPPCTTPAEFSKLKHERELKMAEKQEHYRQQLLAQSQAVARQRAQGGQIPGMPGSSARPNGLPNGPVATALSGMSNGNLAVPGHARPHPGMNGMPNGMPNGAPFPPGMMGPKAAQQAAQMQLMAARMANSPENQRRILEQVAHVQQQQLLAQQAARQHAGQGGNHSSPNAPNASLATPNGVNSSAYMAALAGANGSSSPAVQGDGTQRSPRHQAGLQNMGQALSSGQIPLINKISSQIRAQYPHFTDEQVFQAATHQLTIYSQQVQNASAVPNIQKQRTLNQAALNAAMGAANAGAHASALAAAYGQNQAMMTNEQVQQYNQRMRAQQAAQRAGGFPGNAMSTNGLATGMGASPVLNMARPVSQHSAHSASGQGQLQGHGQISRSATPRDQRSGSGGNGAGLGMMGSQGSPRQQTTLQPQ